MDNQIPHKVEETLVQIEKVNTRGRDLIVPDLHGCPQMLLDELDRLNFDPTVDRVFLLGDLIDRGPNSLDALRLLRTMKSVRGNHEDLLLSFAGLHDSVYHSDHDFLMNGGKWVLSLKESEMDELHKELLPLVQHTPYVRTVVNADGEVLYHMTHAELMRPVPRGEDVANGTVRGFFTDDEILALAQTRSLNESMDVTQKYFIATTTWGRRTIRGMSDEDRQSSMAFPLASGDTDGIALSSHALAQGLSPTFVGHTILPTICMHASHIFMDRGAVMGNWGEPGRRLVVIDAHKALEWIRKNVPHESRLERPLNDRTIVGAAIKRLERP